MSAKIRYMSYTEFGERYEIDKNFVGRRARAKTPQLDLVTDGKRKKIDLNGPLTKAFILKHAKNKTELAPSKPQKAGSLDAYAAAELAVVEKALLTEAQREGQQLKNAVIRGDLIKREMVYEQIMFFIDQVFSNIDRNATTVLDDIAMKIVKEGKVTSKIRNEWTAINRQAKRDAIDEICKRLEGIQKTQLEDA